MPTSMTLQLKISGTKKRLSNTLLPAEFIPALALSCLIAITAVLVRLIAVGGSYTSVPLEIPVMPATIQDKSLAGFKEIATKSLDRSTVGIVLTPTEFIFGDLASFTLSKDDIRTKFIVPHVEGSPQVSVLTNQILAWQEDRGRRLSIRSDKIAVIFPDSRIPMNILIQVISLLRESQIFENVILGGGLK